MHFSVLVPVKVPVVSDEAKAKAIAANLYIDALKQQSDTEQTGSIMDNVLHKLHLQHAQSVSTPFAAEVDEAVSEAMEPYSQDTEDPRYRIFEDETEDLKEEFETGTSAGILYNGKYYGRYDIPGFEVCKDGVVREKTSDGKHFLSPKAQQMTFVENIPNKEFYGTFRKFAKERSYYCKEKKAWGYFSNPNCFWDWYSIGGRWRGSLLVKDTVEDAMLGIPGVGDNSEPQGPTGYKWVDAARLKDIELEEMARQEEARIRDHQAKYKAIWEGTYVATDSKDDFSRHVDKRADGLYYFGRRIYDPTVDVETVVKNHNCVASNALCSIFHAYLDTEANVPEEYGYYDKDCIEGDWNEQFNDFISDLDPDTVIVAVDCHM